MSTPTNKPAYVTLHRLGELSGRSRNTLLLLMRGSVADWDNSGLLQGGM